jgi:hypothetical protein
MWKMETLKLHATSQPSSYRTGFFLVYTLAVLFRIWRYLAGGVTDENGIIGLAAEAMLRGDYPVFLPGKIYMGTLDSLLCAPLIWLFGPSALILNLWPPLLSLGMMVFLHLTMKRVLTPLGVLAGLAWISVPPSFWFWYTGYAQIHYAMLVFLGSAQIYLTARLMESDTWSVKLALSWGMLAGLSGYMHPLNVAIAAPCLVVLLVFQFKKLRLKNILASTAGCLVCSLPIWLAFMNTPHTVSEQVGAPPTHTILQQAKALFDNALPIILGFNTPPVGGSTTPFNLNFLLYTAGLAVLGLGLAKLIKTGVIRQRVALVPALIIAANCAILVFSSYGTNLDANHQAYLLPLYTSLPFAFGAAAGFIGKKSRPAAAALVLLLMLANGWGYIDFKKHGLRLLANPGHLWHEEARYENEIEQLAATDIQGLYTRPSYLFNYYGNRKILISEPWEERLIKDSWLVDIQDAVGFWGMKGLKPSFQLLGLDFKEKKIAGRDMFFGFKLPGPCEMLPAMKSRAKSLGGVDLADSLTDYNLKTGFATNGKARPGQGFVLELDKEVTLCGFSLKPLGYSECPTGLKVEYAGVDGVFKLLREVEEYWGPMFLSGPHPMLKIRHFRVDCLFSPLKIKKLRLSHLGTSPRRWSVKEIHFYAPRVGANPGGWQKSLDQAVDMVNQKQLHEVYADVWAAAGLKLKVPEVQVIAGNRYTNTHGSRDPHPNEPLVLTPRKGSALLVEERYGKAVRGFLEKAGIGYTQSKAGLLELVEPQPITTGQAWPLHSISASHGRTEAKNLLEPHSERWGSKHPQTRGMNLVVDLGQPRAMAWLRLASPDHPRDWPRGLEAAVSQDGKSWSRVPINLSSPLCFSGQGLLELPGPVNLYRLEVSGEHRYLKISLTKGHPVFWWSVQKLEVLGPESAKG